MLQVLWLQLRLPVLPNGLAIGVRRGDQETIGEEIGKIAIVRIEKEHEVAPLRRNGTDRGGIDEETKSMTELGKGTKTAMDIGVNIGITSHLGGIDGTEIRNTLGDDVSDHTRGLPAILRTGTEVPTVTAIEDTNANLHILLDPFPVPAHQSRTNLGGQSERMRLAPAVHTLRPALSINECRPCLL